MGTQHQQCIDGEWTSAPPICELIQEAPKPAELELEKALVSSGLFSVLFTVVTPGPDFGAGTCSGNSCSFAMPLNGLILACL